MLRKTLLLCGIASALYYVALNVYVPAHYDGYSVISQTVSEISAIGAPTRPLWVWSMVMYGLLLIAFGAGVWLSGRDSRPLRIAGALVIAQGVFGFFWPPMHTREVLAAGGGTLTDTLHIVWTAVNGVLMVVAMGYGAVAFGRRFRIYSVVTILLLLGLGVVTGMDAPSLQANLPTPWMGVWERIDIGFFVLWVIVLATALWSRREEVPSLKLHYA